MTTQFDRVYYGPTNDSGKFRIAASGMAWKSAESERVVAMASGDIQWVEWIRVARNYQLRLGMKDRDNKRQTRRECFDGFLREDHDKLASLLKQHFGLTLETKEVSFKGWNWGVTDFQGQELAFMTSNKTAFEVSLKDVANSNIAGRTEVSLEFITPSTSTKQSKASAPDEMVEIRFYVPGTQARVRGSEDGSQKSDAEEDDEVNAAQVFHNLIKEKADIGQVQDDIIVSFEEVPVQTPRGRYDMDMFPEFLRLRGKTYDYKILYSTIARLFLLPKDDQHVLFILELANPIRQGQTRYQYLVIQFSKEEETTAELNMSEEEIAKYDRLQKNYEDPTFEVVSSVFRALSKKKIIGSGAFQSRTGHPGIKANLKAVQGDLFLLEKYVFFVSKQPALVEISNIHQVVFSRVGASMGAAAARTFDLKIITKSGPEYTFSSLNKEEHEPVESYFKDKRVKIKNEMVPDADMIMAAVGADDDDDDDDDMRSIDSDGPRRVPRGSDDSESDEDFAASDSDSGSPSESDSNDSGAETASDASGDLQVVQPKKSKTKKAGKKKAADQDGDDSPKKKGKAKKKDDDNGDDEADKPKKAPAKPKPKAADKMNVDAADKPRPKPKPKAKAKAKDDSMDVDEPESSKKKEEGPPKKKAKLSD